MLMGKLYRILIVLLLMTFRPVSLSVMAKSPEKYVMPTYDIVCCGEGVEGTYLAKVSVYLEKPDRDAEDNLVMAAVHGVMFRGMSAGEECKGQRALIPDANVEQEKADFFEGLFGANAAYRSYASLVAETISVTKVSKKQYLVSGKVSVKKDELRKLLEKEKIIQGFNDLF